MLRPEANCASYSNQVDKLAKEFPSKVELEHYIASVYAGNGICHVTVLARELKRLYDTYYIPRKRFYTDPERYCLDDAKKIQAVGNVGWHVKNPKWLLKNMRDRYYK